MSLLKGEDGVEDLDQVKQAFLHDSAALLADMAAGLAARQPRDSLPAAGRAVHAIRSGAAAFEMEALADAAHRLETVLERAGDGEIEASAEVVALVARGADLLLDMVQGVEAGISLSPQHGADVLRALALLGADEISDTDAGDLGHNSPVRIGDSQPMEMADRQFLTVGVAAKTYGIDLRAVRKVACGAEATDLPVVDLRALCGLGAAPAGGRHPVVIVDDGARRIALLVDGLPDILTAGPDDVEAEEGDEPWLSGWVTVGQSKTPLLAVDKLYDEKVTSSFGKW
jgi:chemotaxis protein histidine kinase CheA